MRYASRRCRDSRLPQLPPGGAGNEPSRRPGSTTRKVPRVVWLPVTLNTWVPPGCACDDAGAPRSRRCRCGRRCRRRPSRTRRPRPTTACKSGLLRLRPVRLSASPVTLALRHHPVLREVRGVVGTGAGHAGVLAGASHELPAALASATCCDVANASIATWCTTGRPIHRSSCTALRGSHLPRCSWRKTRT